MLSSALRQPDFIDHSMNSSATTSRRTNRTNRTNATICVAPAGYLVRADPRTTPVMFGIICLLVQGTMGLTHASAPAISRPIALPSGIGTALPICRAMAVRDPANR